MCCLGPHHVLIPLVAPPPSPSSSPVVPIVVLFPVVTVIVILCYSPSSLYCLVLVLSFCSPPVDHCSCCPVILVPVCFLIGPLLLPREQLLAAVLLWCGGVVVVPLRFYCCSPFLPREQCLAVAVGVAVVVLVVLLGMGMLFRRCHGT